MTCGCGGFTGVSAMHLWHNHWLTEVALQVITFWLNWPKFQVSCSALFPQDNILLPATTAFVLPPPPPHWCPVQMTAWGTANRSSSLVTQRAPLELQPPNRLCEDVRVLVTCLTSHLCPLYMPCLHKYALKRVYVCGCLCVCTHLICARACVCVCVCVYHVSSCSITTPTVQTAGELEGLQTDLWVLSASSSVSIRVVIESCEFVSFTQIYWNDIHLLSALGTHFRLHFEIRALCCFRAAEKQFGK